MTHTIDRLSASLAERYRIERELGAGGMATVYLAHDIRHDRDVAIKVLHPDLGAALGGERFLAEIKTTAKLHHPHILPLLDSGDDDGLLYYVMPFVSGETLRARLERERQLPIDDAVRIAREIADALGAAHSLGIIHRDIKPENVLLQGGHALVADFGIALAVQTAGGQRMTQTGLSLGTPQYMSPEQAMGERTIDARADIYALGAVTYEMLAGEAPFTGPSVQAIVARVMSEEPRGLVTQRKAVPDAVEGAVLRALEKLPADRFATAGEFAAALSSGAPSTTAVRRTAASPTRNSRAMLVASALTVVMTALAAWGWLRPHATPPVVRYLLTADSVTQLHDWMGEIALSPDGSTLAYGGGLNGLLRLRRRDALGFTTIPGTDGAISPCFSPDGKQIAFWRNAAFVVMPVDGGKQVILDDSLDVPESCSWGEDGYIYRVLSPRGVYQIIRMRPEPNAVQNVVVRADTTTETSISLPEALPNGKAVLFQVQTRNGKTAIGAADVATGHRTVVLPDGIRARYGRNGQLLYTTLDGKLWSAAFDQASLKVSGEPTLVGDGIPSTMVGPTDFAVSASGTLAYAVDYTSTLAELVMVSRSGVDVPVDSAWRGRFASPVLSRDGSLLAVSVINGKGSDIWVKRTSGGLPQKFTLERGNNSEPEFTPDGGSLSFINGGTGTARWLSLLVQPLQGGGRATPVLEKSDRSISEHTWSPAGHMVAVRTTTNEGGAGDILAGSMDASPMKMTPIVASSRSEYSPTISPDGRFMAYASNESGRFEVYVVPFPNPGSSKWQVTTTGGRAPRWSKRGGEIFYIDLSSNLVSAAVTTSPAFAVQSRTVLFNAAAYSILAISRHSFDVMPDDQHFLMIRRRGGSPSAQMVVVENWFTRR